MLAMLIGGVQRGTPSGLPTLPIRAVATYGVTNVATNYTSAVDAAIAYYPTLYNSTACTVGTGGTDTVAASNTFFATISYACKTWTGGSVINCVSDITEDPLDFRSTDTSQIGVAKTINGAANNGSGLIRIQTSTAHTYITGQRVVIASVTGTTEANGNWLITVTDSTHFDLTGSTFANAYVSGGTATNQIPLLKIIKANGFNVMWRQSAAVDPVTATYTADGTLTNIYGTPTSWLASSATVTRVLRTDITDTYGFPRQFKKYATKAALAAATTLDGWFWDNAAKQLWVHLAGDLNVNTNKAILKVMFTSTSGNARTIVQGAQLAFDGIVSEGVQLVSIDSNGRRNGIWCHNYTSKWANAKGWDGTQAGDFVHTRLRMYYSAQDGLNAFAKSATGTGLVVGYDPLIVKPGDLTYFDVDGTIQCISCHGGSDHVLYGGRLIASNGQAIGDTTSSGEADVTWCIGAWCDRADGTSDNLQFGGSAGTRQPYLDTCKSTSAGGVDLQITSPGTTDVKVYQTPLGTVNGGTTTAFVPTSP